MGLVSIHSYRLQDLFIFNSTEQLNKFSRHTKVSSKISLSRKVKTGSEFAGRGGEKCDDGVF